MYFKLYYFFHHTIRYNKYLNKIDCLIPILEARSHNMNNVFQVPFMNLSGIFFSPQNLFAYMLFKASILYVHK